MEDPRIEQDTEDSASNQLEEYHGVMEVEKLLEEPLDTENTTALVKQIAQAEGWLSRVSFQYRNSEAMLKQMKKQYLLPKSKELTDMDRTINLEYSTRILGCQVDLLKDQAEILRNRISLGQSLLSTHREEMKRSIR